MILARGSVLGVSDFELPDPRLRAGSPFGRRSSGRRAKQIEEALAASRGRVSGPQGAAEALGVPASTLESRIRRFRIDKLGFRRRVPGQ